VLCGVFLGTASFMSVSYGGVIITVVTGIVTMGVPTMYQQVITELFLLAVVGIAILLKKAEVVK
jgi:hypothetical protein